MIQSVCKFRIGALNGSSPGGQRLFFRRRRTSCHEDSSSSSSSSSSKSAPPISSGSMPRPSVRTIISSSQQQYHQGYHQQSQYHHHHQQQQRHKSSSSSSSSSSSAVATTAATRNPFDVMGIPRDSCPEIVRQTFLQLAMKYHPDTSSGDEDTSAKFQQIRAAFERITKAVGKTNRKIWLTEEVFNLWFAEHTGLRMDAATRREVMLSYRDGACKNSSSRTRYLPPEWQIAFILEKEGMFTKKLTCNRKDFTVFGGGGRAVVSHSGARRKRGF